MGVTPEFQCLTWFEFTTVLVCFSIVFFMNSTMCAWFFLTFQCLIISLSYSNHNVFLCLYVYVYTALYSYISSIYIYHYISRERETETFLIPPFILRFPHLLEVFSQIRRRHGTRAPVPEENEGCSAAKGTWWWTNGFSWIFLSCFLVTNPHWSRIVFAAKFSGIAMRKRWQSSTS